MRVHVSRPGSWLLLAFAGLSSMAGCGAPPLEEGGTIGVLSESLVPLDRTVAVTVAADTATHTITLSWPLDNTATGYNIARKPFGSPVWEAPVALAGNATSYADSTITNGLRYEYQVIRNGPTQGTTYLAVGADASMLDSRGTVVLIVDATFTNTLAVEIGRLIDDLRGDGWRVIRHDVSRNASVAKIKAVISDDALGQKGVRTVFLLGHVPVPYSGQIAPDGHGDHVGAWPADLYYGALNTTFTDVSVNTTTASRVENRNVPGDGKFDQSFVSSVQLEVGRVDLANMPAFAPKTELDLLRQYLDKDHNFRHRVFTLQRRGLVNDNFGDFGGEAFAASGYRNFIADFGPGNITAAPTFPTLANNDYLFSYGCGGGWYTSAAGVGSTADWAATDARTAFTFLFGSYFGDWDSTDNFLRAPLASASYGLTSAWSGRPQWYAQAMAIGETIGYGAKITHNNTTYSPLNFGNQQIHVALMGDPTLRLHPVIPPGTPRAKVDTSIVGLSWAASPEATLGYHVYRASTNPGDSFARLTRGPIAGTSYVDSGVAAGSYRYMVRAVKRELVAAGSYVNPSQGVFVNVNVP